MSGNSADKGLVFDLDGTLVNTADDLAHSVNHIRTSEGLAPLSTPQVLQFVGRGAVYLMKRAIGLEEGETERLDRVLRQFQDHYLAHQTERSSPFPGIREMLAEFHGRYRMYVLSNKPHEATVKEVEGHGLLDFFDDVWGAGALPALKPDPAGVVRAVEKSGLPRERFAVVGDMATDIETGINAGVKTCFVTWGFGSLPETPRPTAVAHSVRELADTLGNLFSQQDFGAISHRLP